MARMNLNNRAKRCWTAVGAIAALTLLSAMPGCGGSGGLGILGNLPGLSLLAKIPGVGLLNNVATGPIGGIFTLASDLLTPPATPLEGEINGPLIPQSTNKIITDVALPQPITPQLLAALDSPPSCAALGPDGRIYYTEKSTGRVRIFNPATATVLPDVVLDLAVNSSGSRGLIGISFTLDGKQLLLTYDSSTNSADTAAEPEARDSRLVSYPFAAGKVSGPETIYFTTAPRDPNFPSDLDGIGPVVVAPTDGYIYFAHGDRNSRLTALDVTSSDPSGKILRLNPDGSIPSGNVFKGKPTYLPGFRRPTGMAFDTANGLFWFLEESAGVSDELNLGAPGLYYGWPLIEGSANTTFESSISQVLPFIYQDPIIDFGFFKFSPRGIVVNRNGPYGSEMDGDLFFGQTASTPNVVWRYRINTELVIQRSHAFDLPPGGGRICDLVKGPDGRIYVFAQNELYVLQPGPPPP